jgi:NAD(P)-dependent dehydrogenase (short-subunit alcohol dehydrogenase family)
MSLTFNHRVALVTGAGRGLGKALAGQGICLNALGTGG